MKRDVGSVILSAGFPLSYQECVIDWIIAKVHTGNSSGSVFGSLCFIDVSINETEEGSQEEALIDWKFHACSSLSRRSPIISTRW